MCRVFIFNFIWLFLLFWNPPENQTDRSCFQLTDFGLSEKMATPVKNRFMVLNDFADKGKTTKKGSTSPPVKKTKKKDPLKSNSSESKTDSDVDTGKKSRAMMDPKKTANKTRMESKETPPKPNRRLVLSDDSDSTKENDDLFPDNVEQPRNPDPPAPTSTTCPATDLYVKIAREHHHIPTMDQLLDRAGSFGKMFEDGHPVDCLATDVINVNDIYGMKRQRFDDRKVFEREKINLYFSLVKKYKHRIPNLYKIYNSVYNLEESE